MDVWINGKDEIMMPCPYNADGEVYQKCADEMYGRPDPEINIGIFPGELEYHEIPWHELMINEFFNFFGRIQNDFIHTIDAMFF